jgi:hypothetical protein
MKDTRQISLAVEASCDQIPVEPVYSVFQAQCAVILPRLCGSCLEVYEEALRQAKMMIYARQRASGSADRFLSNRVSLLAINNCSSS